MNLFRLTYRNQPSNLRRGGVTLNFTRHKAGSILIEVSIAAGIAAIGLGAILLGFIQANRSTNRTNLTPTALNIIQSQINKDATVPYDQLDSYNPPLDPITLLPGAEFTRVVEENTEVLGKLKTVRYVLKWDGTGGPQTVQSEYELTEQGIVND